MTSTSAATIREIVDACETYWVLSGIPRTQINDMLLELDHHLHAAVRDGKPINQVIGDDLQAFAAAWAEPNRVADGCRRALLAWGSPGLGLLLYLVLVRHLRERAFAFEVGWADIATLAILLPLGSAALPMLRSSAMLAPRRSWWRHPWLLLTTQWLLVVALLVAVGLALRIFAPAVIFVWSWPLTLLLLIAASITTSSFIRDDVTRPEVADRRFDARLLLALGGASLATLGLWAALPDPRWVLATAFLAASCLITFWLQLVDWATPHKPTRNRLLAEG
jgi:hypothetical protein